MTIGCLPKFSMCESGKIRQWALYACSAAVTTWVVSTLDQPVWVAHDAARVAHGVAEGVGQNLDIVARRGQRRRGGPFPLGRVQMARRCQRLRAGHGRR